MQTIDRAGRFDPEGVPMSEQAGTAPSTTPPAEVDPTQAAFVMEQLRSEQNLFLGTMAGAAAAAVGAALWAGITVVTHYQIGWVAIGVGYLVGVANRKLGKGIDRIFGVVGAGLAMLGCLLGNLLAVCGAIARQEHMPILEVLSRLNPTIIKGLMIETFNPMDLLFYGIAVYEAYKLSFMTVSPEEVKRRLTGYPASLE